MTHGCSSTLNKLQKKTKSEKAPAAYPQKSSGTSDITF